MSRYGICLYFIWQLSWILCCASVLQKAPEFVASSLAEDGVCFNLDWPLAGDACLGKFEESFTSSAAMSLGSAMA